MSGHDGLSDVPDPRLPPEEEHHRPFPDPEHSIAPRKPRTVGGAVFLVVLAVTLLGLLLVVLGPWRGGLMVMGGSAILGGLARLVLREEAAGMLGVRRKLVDVSTLVGLGAALCLLAAALRGGPL
jgi:hypothetical protein